jgi:hypothetical protein
MKRVCLYFVTLAASMILTVAALATTCTPTYTQHTLIDTWCSADDLTILKSERNYIDYRDGFQTSVDTKGYGGCDSYLNACYPEFHTPETETYINPQNRPVGRWYQKVVDKAISHNYGSGTDVGTH